MTDILFLQTSGNYCEIRTPEHKLITKKGLVNILELLPEDIFVRVHRSYAVRIDAITRINTRGNEIEIGEHVIPLGRRYRDEFLDRLKII